MFFDESKNDPTYDRYHIGGVCIDETELFEIEARVSAISESVFGSGELNRGSELHAVDIFHRKSNFKDIPDFGVRLKVFSEFAEILSLDTLRLIDIQINCGKLYDTQVPADIAFMYFCERANDLMRSERSLGILVGDRESDRIAARYSMTLSKYRAEGTNYAFGRDISCLVDSVHFTHSHLSRFLQLADVYTWFLQFRIRHQNSEHPRHEALRNVLGQENINLFPSKYKEWPK